MYCLRQLGISLWNPVPYAEVELLIGEMLSDPDSRLAQAVASRPSPMDEAQSKAVDETMKDYRKVYGF